MTASPAQGASSLGVASLMGTLPSRSGRPGFVELRVVCLRLIHGRPPRGAFRCHPFRSTAEPAHRRASTGGVKTYARPAVSGRHRWSGVGARADIADVAAAVLRDPAAHSGTTYLMTG